MTMVSGAALVSGGALMTIGIPTLCFGKLAIITGAGLFFSQDPQNCSSREEEFMVLMNRYLGFVCMTFGGPVTAAGASASYAGWKLANWGWKHLTVDNADAATNKTVTIAQSDI